MLTLPVTPHGGFSLGGGRGEFFLTPWSCNLSIMKTIESPSHKYKMTTYGEDCPDIILKLFWKVFASWSVDDWLVCKPAAADILFEKDCDEIDREN